MSTLPIAEARERFEELCATVAETGEPIFIEKDGQTFVLTASDDLETERRRSLLFDNPKNAERLRAALTRSQNADAALMSIANLRSAVGIDGRGF